MIWCSSVTFIEHRVTNIDYFLLKTNIIDYFLLKMDLQQDGQMVRDAAGVAGAGVGAEGFLAGMDGVAREQEGDSEDPHSRERG